MLGSFKVTALMMLIYWEKHEYIIMPGYIHILALKLFYSVLVCYIV